jgi:hypothetical protein
MFIAAAGLLGLYGCKHAQLEQRYFVLSAFMLVTGAFEIAGWPIGERIWFTFTILLHNYLCDGDDYLLIFFQIHALTMWYIVSHHAWTFAPHTCLMGFFIFRQLHAKLDSIPAMLLEGSALENMSVSAALFASSLLVGDYFDFATDALPEGLGHIPSLFGHFAKVVAIYASVVLSQYLRCSDLRRPATIDYKFGVIPFVQPISKVNRV